MTDSFGGRVAVSVENWGDSAIAKRLGIKAYPAVLVGDAVFATPQDLGFYGDARSGKYTPWRDPANHDRFRQDLARMLTHLLGGGPSPGGPSRPTDPDRAAPGIPERLPAFSVTDLEGAPLSADSFAGRPVLVEFWATWCPPCLETLGFLSSLRQRHGSAIGIAAFAVESEEEQVRRVAAESAAGLPISIGTPELAASFGNLVAIPTLFLFDRNGRIVEVFHGAPPDLHERVARALEPLLR